MSNINCISPLVTKRTLQSFRVGSLISLRSQSSLASVAPPEQHGQVRLETKITAPSTPTPMMRLSTWSLVRNIVLSHFLTRPVFLKPGLAFMQMVANSQSRFLNPDNNPVLRAILKPVVYDQFCAGTNDAEIRQTVARIKGLGFSGVVLCYGKEIQLDTENKSLGAQSSGADHIQLWKEGTLKTLELLSEGNWLGIKYTGAGPEVTDALCRGNPVPEAFATAMKEICEKAKERNCRIWIDAEQQAVQKGIDTFTISLMREYNQSKVLIYNTVQAYLKSSRQKLQNQLRIAEKEGWTLGVKLVRGAYISNDRRELIHDTKAETDASYNGIVRDVLTGNFEGLSKQSFSHLRLLMAGHNSDTIRTACKLAQDLSEKGNLQVSPEFAQLQGMADDIGCELIQFGENQEAAQRTSTNDTQALFKPRAYKCLTWGSVQECMQYLVRRAVENSGAVDRMREAAAQSSKELRRRVFHPFSRQQ